MPEIPREASLDSTVALRADPYRFIGRRCDRYGTDLFEARILLRRTICVRGEAAAALFHDVERFTRAGAAPRRVQKTLFGRGGVQGLDGEAHRQRKRMFLALMSPERIERMRELAAGAWVDGARRWAGRDQIELYREAQELLCRVVCAWADVPLPAGEVGARTRQLTSLFDAAGAVGPAHWRARLDRKRANAWARRRIEDVRAGRHSPAPGTAVHAVAWHRELDGSLLSPHDAAVELLNVLRPTVAVAVYVVFVALALHDHPTWRGRIAAGEDPEPFVHEVRRYYPFFPALVARVRRDFVWEGYAFPEGTQVLLDVYGTNHDRRAWGDPEAFRPERFEGREPSPFALVPQGGGEHTTNHRCPGEWITIELMKVAASFLADGLVYRWPPQDLTVDLTRLPALPRSRCLLGGVRLREAAVASGRPSAWDVGWRASRPG